MLKYFRAWRNPRKQNTETVKSIFSRRKRLYMMALVSQPNNRGSTGSSLWQKLLLLLTLLTP